MKFYKNKQVWITGGSEGIGAATAELAVQYGAHVTIISRSQTKLDRAVQALKAKQIADDQNIGCQSLDITHWEKTKDVLQKLQDLSGPPDILINCAGLARPGYIHQLPMEDYRKMMELNYFGTLNVVKAVADSMIQRRSGFIVNTSSIAGFLGLFGYTGYCASKFAVIGFSEALRRELAVYNIKVSVLCPPNTRTPGLEEENKSKPPEVLATEEKAKVLEPEEVAKTLLSQIPRGKFLLVPTMDGKFAHLLNRISPTIINQFVKRPKSN